MKIFPHLHRHFQYRPGVFLTLGRATSYMMRTELNASPGFSLFLTWLLQRCNPSLDDGYADGFVSIGRDTNVILVVGRLGRFCLPRRRMYVPVQMQLAKVRDGETGVPLLTVPHVAWFCPSSISYVLTE